MFALARVKQDLLDDLKAYGLADSVGTDLIFPTPPTAVAAYREWNGERQEPVLDARHGAGPATLSVTRR